MNYDIITKSKLKQTIFLFIQLCAPCITGILFDNKLRRYRSFGCLKIKLQQQVITNEYQFIPTYIIKFVKKISGINKC